MKTKNMRKKALLSSLAMLLVAVIALGGATYAWFTSASSVSATGIKLSTNAASDLQIHPDSATAPDVDSENWSNTIAINTTQVLTPMSSSDGEHFYTIEYSGEGLDSPVEKDFYVTNIEDAGTPAEVNFWVRTLGNNTPDLKITSIKKTAAGENEIWKGLRCAVLVDSTLKYVCNPGGTNSNGYVIASLDNDTYDDTDPCIIDDLYKHNAAAEACGVNFIQLNDASNTIFKTSYATQTIQADMGIKTAYHVTVLFWLEGNTTTGAAMGVTLDSVSIVLGADA